jgi:protein-S-isoprenylcysteine O-methyltransferase Ste14
MLATGFGLALMVPNVLAVAGAAGLLLGLERHVRLVEEPYLARVHGESYIRYTERVGRFVPGLGNVRAERTGTSR